MLAILLANAITDLEAVDARQHHVEQYQVEGTAQCHLQSDLAVLGGFHLVAVINEHVDQAAANRGFIFDDQ